MSVRFGTSHIPSVAVGCLLLTGCQTMGATMFPMQNMSRVPPPGTGTYATQGNYYNASPASPPASSEVGTGLKPVNGSLPTTGFAPSNTAMQPAEFAASRNANANAPVQPATYTQTADATLQWQP